MKKILMAAATAALVVVPATGAFACGTPSTTYRGGGLSTEICGVANGAKTDNAHLTWVLAANGATSATITGPWGKAAMAKASNGTFTFISDYYSADQVSGKVSASFSGRVRTASINLTSGCSYGPITIN